MIKLQKSASSKGCSQGDKELQHKAVLRLVKCGELSRAAKILTSKGLADPSDETINKLNLKHPVRLSEEVWNHHPMTTLPIHLKKSAVLESILKAPRGSGLAI